MSYKLVIVESPTKVTSIGRYLKDGYKITSSMGHVRDLPAKGGMNIEIENQFKPNYQINPDKKKLVTELRALAKGASEVIMASDEDREGEAIAWHLCHILKLDPQTTKRIVFHEITSDALKKAIAEPRFINQNLVNAQQARRILDRIVGFELSPVLWKKIRKGLSAGRVQSVAMRLIYDREEEIKHFEALTDCRGHAIFQTKNQEIKADLKEKLKDLEAGRQLLEDCQGVKFEIQNIEIKASLKNPSPPFKTSTLQQEAAQKLGFSVKQTMMNAQKLYEAGLITYMRTDSLNLSQQSLKAAQAYIVAKFSKKYHRQVEYQNQTKASQEAHEAIRPTDFNQETPEKLDSQANRLYQLIWRRSLASQMAPAETDKTTMMIGADKTEKVFIASGQILRFDGFLKITQDGLKDVLLPDVKVGLKLDLIEAHVYEKFSQPPARYGEAGLVKKLEELGIGRPSTYAPTIGTILERGYVIKGDIEPQSRRYRGIVLNQEGLCDYDSQDKWGGSTNKLIPTDLAKIVTPFLKKHFEEIMDYNFTSKIEADFDQIAAGNLDWQEHLQLFYERFHPNIEATQNIARSEIGTMREVGIDPKDQKMIYARLGRFGPMLQKGLAEESEEKPIFAPLPPETTLEDVQLEAALKMFRLPRLVGQTAEGRDIFAKIGRYGPYIQIEKAFVSLKEGDDPFTVDLERALSLIATKAEEEKQKIIADFGDLKILNGRYGPYLTDGQQNAKIPAKDDDGQKIDPTKVNAKTAQAWFQQGINRAKKPGYRKK